MSNDEGIEETVGPDPSATIASNCRMSDSTTIHEVRSRWKPSDIQEQLTYVYLSSVAHSGSTLIACLLGAHPAISTVGEFGSDILGRLKQCSCGKGIAQCEFWVNWQSLAEEAGIPFWKDALGVNLAPTPTAGFFEKLFYYQFPSRWVDRARDLLFRFSPGWQDHWRSAVERSVRLTEILCQHENTRVFLDTTKNSFQIRFLARNRAIRLKLIALVRDGRAVMNSLMKRYRENPESAVGSWLWGNRHLMRASRYLPPGDVLWVKHEDVCSSPDHMMAMLFRFCGVDTIDNPGVSRPHERHIVGNSMRMSFDGSVRIDEAWKSDLTTENLRLFEQRAGWLNRKFGYFD